MSDHGPEAGHCEIVIWRDGSRRCELWVAESGSRLRVFDGRRLVADEPFVKGAGWTQAKALRIWTPERRLALLRLVRLDEGDDDQRRSSFGATTPLPRTADRRR